MNLVEGIAGAFRQFSPKGFRACGSGVVGKEPLSSKGGEGRMAIRKVQVTLETVTPLFLGGSNPRGEPELRAPSFRGAMRFWLRALLGGVIGDDPKKIFEHESKVFGSTEHASPVVVQMERLNLQSFGYSQLTQNRQGIAYLFFGARSFGNQPERKAIPSDFQFISTIRLRVGVQDSKALQAAAAALWLLTHLGGLGMRGRRGGGNLQVISTDWDDPSLPSLISQAQAAEQLQKELQHGLRCLREWAVSAFNGSLMPSFQSPPTFDVLHPNWCNIFVVNHEFSDWTNALNDFGKAMQQFRNRRQPDYSNVKAVIQGQGQLQPIQRAAFGLPIVFYYSSLGREATLKGERHDRRASPLIARVMKLANGRCVLVLTCFRSPLLPDDERLQLRYSRDERRSDQPKPSDALLNEFLSDLNERFGLLEVRGW